MPSLFGLFFWRAVGAGLECDIGAFEYGAIVPVDDVIFANGFE